MEASDLLGYSAAAASLVAFSAKTMIPLRVAAIVSNVLFISYGIFGEHGPPIVLHSILLPLNVHRLMAMRKLIRRVQAGTTASDFHASWLQPYMKRKSFRAGHVIFSRGDVSREVYYLVAGRIRFPEVGRSAEGGLLFGEIAFFTPDGRRTLSCVCETDVEVLFITNDELKQLYFQNPEFGFHLVRLIVGRLVGQIDDLDRRRVQVVMQAPALDEVDARRRTRVASRRCRPGATVSGSRNHAQPRGRSIAQRRSASRRTAGSISRRMATIPKRAQRQ